EITGNHYISCSRALEAAIADSADVRGETGVLLRRTLTDFGAFATRLEEEIKNSTKDQLEKTFKSMINFRVAFDATMNSIKNYIQLHVVAGDSEEVKSAVGFVVDEIKQEEILDYDMIVPKDEPIDDLLSISGDQPFGLDVFNDEIKMEDILNDDMIEPKDELIDEPPNDNQDFGVDLIGDEMPYMDDPLEKEDESNDMGVRHSIAEELVENGGGEDNVLDNAANIHKDSSDTAVVEKRRRSARVVSGNIKYTESGEESDGEVGPIAKKGRSESAEKNKERRSSSKGECQSKTMKKGKEENGNSIERNELKCPECEYRSMSIGSWTEHLRIKHSTTPALAGCLLRCDCGNESYSKWHSETCKIANFTVIYNGGPIRRITDPVVTPQCILCEMNPKTAYGYIHHLSRHHKTTLLANGIYLLCSCGKKF
ncbi:hypothetical protein PMAYCL1PPCAC_14228, partial [Pristionchus mayeri]